MKLPGAESEECATRQRRPPSRPGLTTRQRSSPRRRNRIALGTSLPLQVGAQFFFRQSSVTNRAPIIALEYRRFDRRFSELLISVFGNHVTIGQFLDLVFTQRQSTNAPRVRRHRYRIRKDRVGNVILLQEFFHEFRGRIRSTQNRKALPRLGGGTVGRNRTIVIDPQKQILFRTRADLGEQQ